jgi:hypothetical protein
VLGSLAPREAATLRDGLLALPDLFAEIEGGGAEGGIEGPMERGGSDLLAELAKTDPVAELAAELSRVLLDEPAANLADGGVIAEGVDDDLDRARSLAGDTKRHILAMEQREREETGISSLLSRPGCGGRPACSQFSFDDPPFQARVVKPRISTFTPQRSKVRARMSAHSAATMIGRPRIEPELSSSNVTTVSLNGMSSSCLNDSGDIGSVITRVSRAVSSTPSSRSKLQARFCFAISRRCNRLARRPTTLCSGFNCWSR